MSNTTLLIGPEEQNNALSILVGSWLKEFKDSHENNYAPVRQLRAISGTSNKKLNR